jgi:hypothetical protein
MANDEHTTNHIFCLSLTKKVISVYIENMLNSGTAGKIDLSPLTLDQNQILVLYRRYS